ncbi:EamA family transporter [Mycolicibacterium sp.]|uniref:DMT family transporter n=1 Tax=Mycolicibacterium sp. TaxID=2320850 RepID=UPI001A3074FF|nr:EamA family transporter [Mycolicibacterium sp.]MBJ7341135.1 EamA family transporter [Mycolicibacterium sp.]
MKTRRIPMHVAALVATVVLWASAFPAIRVGLPGLGVAGLSVWRLVVASVALACIAPLLKVRVPHRRDLPLILLAGFAGMAAYQVLLNWGEVHVAAGTASLLVAIAPVFSVLLSAAFLRTRPTLSTVAGSGVALVGAAVIALSGESVHLSLGAVVVLVAAFAQGTYHVAIKPLLTRYTGFEVACYAMWSGTIFVLPLLPTAIHRLADSPASAVASAVYLGVLPSAVGFVTWSYAVARLPVERSTAALYLIPPVALLVALVWLGERPRAIELVGGLIGITGVILINRWRTGADAPPEGQTHERLSFDRRRIPIGSDRR